MKNYKANKQSGMTLIELAVVLVILVGLAGLLIPYVSSFIGKTHASTSGQTIAALNMAMNRFTNESFGGGGFPDNLDSLIDEGGTVVGIADGTQYQLEALNPNAVAALTGIGIDTIQDQTAGDVTFGAPSAPRGIAGIVNVVTLTPAGITNLGAALGIDTAGTDAYVVLGVGASSDLNGRVISEAPVHFHEGAMNYDMMYSRFLAVFKIPGATDDTLANATGDNAKFVGIVGPMDPIEGIGGHIQEYREIVAAENG